MSLTPLLLKSNWIKMTFQRDWRKEGIFIYTCSRTTVSDENSLWYNSVLPRTPLWAEQRVLKCSTTKMLIRMTNSWPTVFTATAMAVNYFLLSSLVVGVAIYEEICKNSKRGWFSEWPIFIPQSSKNLITVGKTWKKKQRKTLFWLGFDVSEMQICEIANGLNFYPLKNDILFVAEIFTVVQKWNEGVCMQQVKISNDFQEEAVNIISSVCVQHLRLSSPRK